MAGAYCFSNFSATELRQYLTPVGCGPSSKTWPRCDRHLPHITSVRAMPRLLSVSVVIFDSEIGVKKLGQPVPESNFVSELNTGKPQAAQ